MSIDYTTDQIISDMKQIASLPTSQKLYENENFVRFLDLKLRSSLVPLILRVRQDFYLSSTDFSITSTTSATNAYAIPTNAIGMKLKRVVLVDGSGNERELPRIHLNDLSVTYYTDYQRFYGYYIQDNAVKLYKDDAYIGQTLRMYYFRRPNSLVQNSEAGQIQTINGNLVTLISAPTSWTTANTFDAIANYPGFKALGEGLTITNKSGFDLTFTSIPSTLAVGDWIALSGESPIPQIPYDSFPMLAQIGVMKALEGLGDKSGLQTAINDYADMRKDFTGLISDRVEDQQQKVLSRQGVWKEGSNRIWGR